MTRTKLGAFVYYVMPLLAWMLAIYLFSSDVASADNTRPAVGGILRLFPILKDHLTFEQIDGVNYVIRKMGHVTEYLILSVLAYRAFAFGNPRFRSRNIWLPWCLCVLYACSDEFHQSFYPSRGPSISDVFIDAGGAALGLLICVWRWVLDRLNEKEPAA